MDIFGQYKLLVDIAAVQEGLDARGVMEEGIKEYPLQVKTAVIIMDIMAVEHIITAILLVIQETVRQEGHVQGVMELAKELIR